jgi:hypothetical protein
MRHAIPDVLGGKRHNEVMPVEVKGETIWVGPQAHKLLPSENHEAGRLTRKDIEAPGVIVSGLPEKTVASFHEDKPNHRKVTGALLKRFKDGRVIEIAKGDEKIYAHGAKIRRGEPAALDAESRDILERFKRDLMTHIERELR